jgi:hypothetical protein
MFPMGPKNKKKRYDYCGYGMSTGTAILFVYHKTRQDKTRQVKTRQDKTRQDKTRQDKTRQDKTRQLHVNHPILFVTRTFTGIGKATEENCYASIDAA